jgi:hypothetical protein
MTDPFATTTAATADPFAAGADDPFGDPAPRSNRPRLGDLYDRSDNGAGGRLLLIIPERIQQVPDMERPSELVDRMTADVIVLDGGPLHWGGKPHGRPAVPHTKVDDVPFKIERMFVSSVGIVNQCRDALKARQNGQTAGSMVVGRLSLGESKSPNRNAPYFLAKGTDQDKALARRYWQAHLAAANPFS